MTITINKQKIKNYTTGFLIIIGTAILGIFFITRGSNPETVSAELLRDEFGSAYTEEIDSSGELVEIDLEASEGEIEIFDGFKTQVWNYNGSVPGPEIRIKIGDTLKVNFTNNLPDETTIHWHGVRVPNAMDGVPGINQDPIQPGESFVYEFTPKDAGTFWFHPHVRGSEQLERGLFGTLIVEDDTSEQYSQDIVWVVDDWRMTEDYQVDSNFVTGHDLAHDGRWGNVITVNANLNETLAVRPGERVRLRIVNSSNARVYTPSFGSLDAKIIAVDGMYVKEVQNASGFELSPGNRIDVDIKIPSDTSGKSYEIYDNYTRYSNQLGEINVEGGNVATPLFEYPTNQNIPDWNDAINAKVDKEYKLNARRTSGGMGMMGGIEWTINDKAYPDYEPFEFKYNKFNKIKFTNESYRLHPMHLHGQFFKVLSRNGKVVNEPFLRDTVLLSSQETVEIAFVPLDKGEWAQHCHIQEHADAGMMNTVIVN